jgi:hypothetical protein
MAVSLEGTELSCGTNTSANLRSVLCLWFYRAWWHWLWRSLCPGMWHLQSGRHQCFRGTTLRVEVCAEDGGSRFLQNVTLVLIYQSTQCYSNLQPFTSHQSLTQESESSTLPLQNSATVSSWIITETYLRFMWAMYEFTDHCQTLPGTEPLLSRLH